MPALKEVYISLDAWREAIYGNNGSVIETVPDSLTFNLREEKNGKIEWLPIVLSKDELLKRCKLHSDKNVDIVAIDIDDMSKQLLRCGTSIGANTRESKNAQSRMDFLSKLNIALKEADETEYWLDLLHETKYLDDKMFNSLERDCKELIAILVTIIKKIKENKEEPKAK